MGHFVPHSEADIERMLSDIGLRSLEELFEVIPEALRLAGGLGLADGLSEPDVAVALDSLAGKNRCGPDLVCFAGAGAYDHDIPAVTRRLASRSEFVTAYTPYQPEVSQGVLQALFEYQTFVARLSGLDIANASLYDGASATVEALNMAGGGKSHPTMWVSGALHPNWRSVISTFAAGSGHQIVEIPVSGGVTDWARAPEGHPAAIVVANPNFFGAFEDVPAAKLLAQRYDASLVVAFDPVSAGLLRTPGEMGADIAVAEGQPFGTPLSFGGPYLGLFACRSDLVRRLPGRLVGRTRDGEGRSAYVTTLRAREQDIRREKATSNVCTNQTLIAVAAMIQLSWLGTGGLGELALRCARGARYARESLLAVPGVTPFADAPTLREFAVTTPVDAATVIDRMAEEGFLAGVAVGLEGGVATMGGEALLVAVTERRTRQEIDRYVECMAKVTR